MTEIESSPSTRTRGLLTWLLRLLTGATFVISGFVKAVDPYGTFYKLQDYMGAMHLPSLSNLLLVGAFALFASEFIIGVFLLLGCFRKSTPILAMVFMAVMLPLTFWIAVWNPVEDCGCFGDAIILSNWETFWKNVVLTGCIIWLIKFNVRCRCLIMPSLQWIALMASGGYIIVIGLIGYLYQPLVDFRPYRTGEALAEPGNSRGENEENPEYSFIYAKDGIEKRYTIDDVLPDEDSGWVFVRREEPGAQRSEGEQMGRESTEADAEDKTFRIWSEDGKDDVTDYVLTPDQRMILLMMPDLSSVSAASSWQINSLHTWAEENDIDFSAIVSGNPEEINAWKDISLASYPIFTADDTEIKMAVRGNPAVIYLENGRIIWKSTLKALGTKDFQAAESRDPKSYARNDRSLLFNTSGVFLSVVALLICISIIPFRKFFRISRGDRGGHAGWRFRDKSAQ